MKKFLVFILAVFYLCTSTGATIHFHYCMGKFVNWNLRNNQNESCGRCGMKLSHQSKNNGCCKDEYKQIKNDNDQKLPQTNHLLIQPVYIAPPTYQSAFLFISHSTISEASEVSNAPSRSWVSIHIRNCIFMI